MAVSNRSLNILHHGWLNSSISNHTFGYYPAQFVLTTKNIGNVSIRINNVNYTTSIRSDSVSVSIRKINTNELSI